MRSIRTPRVSASVPASCGWLALVLLAALTACSDSDGAMEEAQSRATTITVEVPDGRTASVAYSVGCFGLQAKVGMTDIDRELETVADGLLELVGVGGDGRVPPTTVWRAVINLPAASCFVDLRAHDDEEVVLCSATEALRVDRAAPTEKYVLLSCEEPAGEAGLAIEAP